jgi:hypothetical protein
MNLFKTFYGNKKTRKHRKSSSSFSRSRSSKSSLSANSKLNKTLKRQHKNTTRKAESLNNLINDLSKQTATTFKKKRNTPETIIVNLKNLNTGKTVNATVIKEQGKDKFTFLELNSK